MTDVSRFTRFQRAAARGAMPLAVAAALALSACSAPPADVAPGGSGGDAQATSAPLGGGWWLGEPSRSMRAERGLMVSPVAIDVSTMSRHDRTRVGLGSYLVNAASDCAGCHSSQAGFLAGGNPFPLDPDHVVWSRNLTPDPETGMQLTLDEFKESIRTGRDCQ